MRLWDASRSRYRAGMIPAIAMLVAFCFVLTTVVATLHHHGKGLATLTSTVSLSHETATVTTPSIAPADCPLCEWLLTVVAPATAVAGIVVVLIALVVHLLLAMRADALCSLPFPQRRFRGPPFAPVT